MLNCSELRLVWERVSGIAPSVRQSFKNQNLLGVPTLRRHTTGRKSMTYTLSGLLGIETKHRDMKISWGFVQMEERLEGSLASFPRA